MKKSYFVSVLLSLGLLVAAIITAGANILAFLSIPAFIATVFLPVFVTIGVFGLSTFFSSFRLAFQGGEASARELKTAFSLFRLLGNSILLTGFITAMVGFVAILATLQGKDELGSNLVLALMTLFYSLILFLLVALPFKTAIEKRLADAAE